MFQKLIKRARNSDTNIQLLIPLLLSTMLVQVVTVVVRVTTSYRVVELGLSTVWLGIIAAAFALLPIFVAVRVGRYIDRGHDAHTVWIGSAILTACSGAFVLWSSAEALMIVTALMGIGHLMLMASHQMLCVRASGPHTMESVFGNYMVAGAVGQAIGPYVVGWAGGSATMPPTQYLFGVGFVISIVALFVALAMRPGPEREHAEAQSELVPIGKLLRMPGLLTVVVAGVILVSGSDVVLIYVPLLGSERNIDVADIGLLLTVRAAASMVARLFYARMVEITGRWPLMIASTFTCACTFAALAAPLPLYWMHVVMALMGASFGLAATLSITIVVDMTTAGARATGNSLRIMSNRIGQFALPFGAGIVAAATGLAGLFLMLGGAMAVAGVALHWKKPAS